MNTVLLCLIITTSIVLIWDYFQFPYEFTALLASKVLKKKINSDQVELPKPIGCSTCMTFWINLIVLCFINIKLVYLSLLFAFLSRHILSIINLIDSVIQLTIYRVDSALKRIEKRTL